MEKIDLNRVKKITGILSGKVVNIESILEPTKKNEPGKWLYYFNQKYLFVADSKSSIKTEAEAGSLLKDFPTKEDMAVTFAHLTGTEPILPSQLEKHPDVKILLVSASADLANAIYLETLVPIDPKTLDKVGKKSFAQSRSEVLIGMLASEIRADAKKNLHKQ